MSDYLGFVSKVGSITLSEIISQLKYNSNSGAITTFTGIVRDISDKEDKTVIGMEVEVWEDKADTIMTEISKRIGTSYNLLAIRIVHLYGMLKIGDPIVYVVISSIHRKEAFEALEAAIHAYKTESPVWKKELYSDGTSKWIKTADHNKIL